MQPVSLYRCCWLVVVMIAPPQGGIPPAPNSGDCRGTYEEIINQQYCTAYQCNQCAYAYESPSPWVAGGYFCYCTSNPWSMGCCDIVVPEGPNLPVYASGTYGQPPCKAGSSCGLIIEQDIWGQDVYTADCD